MDLKADIHRMFASEATEGGGGQPYHKSWQVKKKDYGYHIVMSNFAIAQYFPFIFDYMYRHISFLLLGSSLKKLIKLTFAAFAYFIHLNT